jgi:hypothetical protein
MCVCKLEAANPVFAFVARQNGRKSCREKIPLAMQGFKWQREVKRFFSPHSLGGEGGNGSGKTAPRSCIFPEWKDGWCYWPVLRQVLKALGHTVHSRTGWLPSQALSGQDSAQKHALSSQNKF